MRRPLRSREVGPLEVGEGEVVHLSAVDRRECRIVVVRQVARKPLRAADERNPFSEQVAADRAVHAGERSEDMVEATVLLHQVQHPLDRPPRIDADDLVEARVDRRAIRKDDGLQRGSGGTPPRARHHDRRPQRREAAPQEPASRDLGHRPSLATVVVAPVLGGRRGLTAILDRFAMRSDAPGRAGAPRHAALPGSAATPA